ncbi:MAG: DUF4149 domain-containing protein [Acidobacteria bacterium]|nr:DUF4149 domain-containing protein [Acidobacteriota bacterium]
MSFAFKLLRDVRLLLVALWLGAAVFFSFAVAPTLFSLLPARELAGTVVTRTLAIINIGGFILSLLLLLTTFPGKNRISKRAFYTELVSLALIALTTFIGQWVISAKLLALRAAMGRPIDAVAATDPLRIAFNSLHGYSVVALSLGMIAAATALLLIARRKA